MDSKSQLRKRLRASRDSLGAGERLSADAAIARRVLASPAFRRADAVFSYLSVGAEVDTRAVIRAAWGAGKIVAAPRVVPGTRSMRWYRIDGFDGLETGSFGIEEPPEDVTRLIVPPASGPRDRAVALVPGLSFDAGGYRLGYGGGFYDVFLAGFCGTAIGLCRRAQLSPVPLPRGEFDLPVDFLVTD